MQEGTSVSATYLLVTTIGNESVIRHFFFGFFSLAEFMIFAYLCKPKKKFMDRKTIEDAIFPDCPIRNILARFSDKWSLLVIYTLNKKGDAFIRFKELHREIPDISQKMLTVTLRTLEEDGYVTRTIYPEVPPRVEYALTDRTKSLLPHINSLIGWALENKEAIIKDRKTAASK